MILPISPKNIDVIWFRLAINDGIDTYKHCLIVADNPDDLPAKGEIVDLGYKSPESRFENKIEDGLGEKKIKIYVIHNFKIMRENENGAELNGKFIDVKSA